MFNMQVSIAGVKHLNLQNPNMVGLQWYIWPYIVHRDVFCSHCTQQTKEFPGLCSGSAKLEPQAKRAGGQAFWP